MYSETSSYNGDWKLGIRHGHGEFVMSDGSVYRGQWENDKPHGKGTLSIPYINYSYNGVCVLACLSMHKQTYGVTILGMCNLMKHIPTI